LNSLTPLIENRKRHGGGNTRRQERLHRTIHSFTGDPFLGGSYCGAKTQKKNATNLIVGIVAFRFALQIGYRRPNFIKKQVTQSVAYPFISN
jgi:hypothetical protein